MSHKPSSPSGDPEGSAAGSRTGGQPGSAAANTSGNTSGVYPANPSGSFSASFSGSFSGSFPAQFADSCPDQNPVNLDPNPEPSQHALVIGCGIAGMTAAAVLSKYFERVTILERDQLPEQPKFRAGKPQGRHAHILLAQGMHLLETIFPQLGQDLCNAGALQYKWGPDTRWYHFGGWRRRYPPALTSISCSVNLIEWALRRRLQQNPRVRILTECTVNELLADGLRVVGLRLQQHRKGRGQKTRELHGSLVVDATGRRSMAPEWLSKLGIGPVPETKVDAFWGYASRYYECPSQPARTWKAMAVHPTPPDSPRMGVIFPLENNLWLATLAGTNRDYPPDDDAGFLEFARGLAQPDLFEAIREAKPVSGIYGYRYAENRLRHFDRVKRSPEGFVALGDAVCQFNPIYGQGMSVAAIGAVQLDRCVGAQLRRHANRSLQGLARNFQRNLARDLRVPWLIATNEDLRYASREVRARRGLSVRLLQGFVRSLLELGVSDYQAYKSFLGVMHLMASPLRLLQPLLLLKVVLHALFARRPVVTPRPVAMPALTPAAMSPRPMSGEAWPALSDPSLLTGLKSSSTPTPAPTGHPTPSGGIQSPAAKKPGLKYVAGPKGATDR
ncbi:MAG TPA: FAD-dependent monooxygenase [Pseudomonadota bacterium]|nr:FAD-dependent monooxygenase [Pseudomonadota bacterium]